MVATSRLDEILDSLGPREWVLEEMQGLDEDYLLYDRLCAELADEDASSWVGIYKGAVVGISESLDDIREGAAAAGLPAWRVVLAILRPPGTVRLPSRLRLA